MEPTEKRTNNKAWLQEQLAKYRSDDIQETIQYWEHKGWVDYEGQLPETRRNWELQGWITRS